MRKLFAILLLVIVALVLATCGRVATVDETLILDNGTAVPPEQKAHLESLEPAFREMLGDTVRQMSGRAVDDGQELSLEGVDPETLLARVKEFMRSEIGENFEEYVIEGSLVPSGSSGSVPTDTPAEARSVATARYASSASFQIFYPPNGGTYWLTYNAKYVRLPWGSWAWANTGIQDASNYIWTTWGLCATFYADEVTPERSDQRWIPPANYMSSQVTGNTKWGFFPTISGIRTNWTDAHDIVAYLSAPSGTLPGTINGNYWQSGWLYWVMP